MPLGKFSIRAEGVCRANESFMAPLFANRKTTICGGRAILSISKFFMVPFFANCITHVFGDPTFSNLRCPDRKLTPATSAEALLERRRNAQDLDSVLWTTFSITAQSFASSPEPRASSASVVLWPPFSLIARRVATGTRKLRLRRVLWTTFCITGISTLPHRTPEPEPVSQIRDPRSQNPDHRSPITDPRSQIPDHRSLTGSGVPPGAQAQPEAVLRRSRATPISRKDLGPATRRSTPVGRSAWRDICGPTAPARSSLVFGGTHP